MELLARASPQDTIDLCYAAFFRAAIGTISTSLATNVSHESTCSIFFCNGSHRAVRNLLVKNLFTNVHIFVCNGSPCALSHPPQSYWHILTPFTTKSNYHTAAQIVRFQRKRRQ